MSRGVSSESWCPCPFVRLYREARLTGESLERVVRDFARAVIGTNTGLRSVRVQRESVTRKQSQAPQLMKVVFPEPEEVRSCALGKDAPLLRHGKWEASARAASW